MTVLALVSAITVPIALLGGLGGMLVERFDLPPRLREFYWSLAFWLPAPAAAILLAAPLLPRSGLLALPTILLVPVAGDGALTAQPATAAPGMADYLIARGPAVLVALAAVGALLILTRLALRHRQLARTVKAAKPSDDAALLAALAVRAGDLGLLAPSLAISDRVSTPILAGLRRPVILIPTALSRLPKAQLDLICAHELAHLKRSDNARILAEDILLALLWFNPLQALLRARLAGSREELCDALALQEAPQGLRRRYAETLVEVLRLEISPQLNTAFIGDGRKGTAMRLKAILEPHGAASRSRLLLAGGLAAALASVVGAGSLAVAAQAGPPPPIAPVTAPTKAQPEISPGIDIVADRSETRPGGPDVYTGAVQVRLIKVTGDPAVDARLAGVTFLLDGRPAAVGFDPSSLKPEATARVELVQEPAAQGQMRSTVNFISGPGTAEPSKTQRSRYSMRSESPDKYRDADALDYQGFCRGNSPGEYGFCAGVLFGLSDKSGACVPKGMDGNLLVERTLPVIAAGSPKAGESLRAFAAASLKAAFPCAG
jgi:beta-lactamase regulating signal transducer with metallopeptidase domain